MLIKQPLHGHVRAPDAGMIAVGGFDLLPALSLLRLRLVSREMRAAVDQSETWCLLLGELDKTNTFNRINYKPISLSSRAHQGRGLEMGATVTIVGLKKSGVCVCAPIWSKHRALPSKERNCCLLVLVQQPHFVLCGVSQRAYDVAVYWYSFIATPWEQRA